MGVVASRTQKSINLSSKGEIDLDLSNYPASCRYNVYVTEYDGIGQCWQVDPNGTALFNDQGIFGLCECTPPPLHNKTLQENMKGRKEVPPNKNGVMPESCV